MADIRNVKIAQIRLDDKNFNQPTVNRALDNIINNINPYMESVTTNINATKNNVSSLDSRVTALEGLVVQKKYGSFYSNGTQTAALNTPTAVTLNGTYISDGITLSNSSHINFAKSGKYNFIASFQVTKNSGSSLKQIWVWNRLNGSDIPNSTTNQHIKDAGSNFVITVNLMLDITAGQYVEYYWAVNDVDINLLAEPSGVTPTRPATPSIIVTIQEI